MPVVGIVSSFLFFPSQALFKAVAVTVHLDDVALVLTLIGMVSLWGLVFAPAAYFLYKAMSGTDPAKASG